MENPGVGTPYLSGGSYTVAMSWDPPDQSGSSSVENYEIRSGSDTWNVSGGATSVILEGITGATTRSFEIRAVNYDGRAGNWSAKTWVYSSVFPTTTTITPPRYKLDEYEGRNQRWDPCGGPIYIKLNPNGYLESSELTEWEPMLAELAVEIAAFTGLNVSYAGTTSIPLRMVHPGGATSTGILIFIGPLGTGHLPGYSAGDNIVAAGQSWIRTWSSPVWVEHLAYDIHLASDSNQDISQILTTRKRFLMNKLGRAFGLDDPGDDIDTEIMSWGGRGSGTWNDPDWGEGDKIGFGLVGASNGCL